MLPTTDGKLRRAAGLRVRGSGGCLRSATPLSGASPRSQRGLKVSKGSEVAVRIVGWDVCFSRLRVQKQIDIHRPMSDLVLRIEGQLRAESGLTTTGLT
jgi:hypothetical protein